MWPIRHRKFRDQMSAGQPLRWRWSKSESELGIQARHLYPRRSVHARAFVCVGVFCVRDVWRQQWQAMEIWMDPAHRESSWLHVTLNFTRRALPSAQLRLGPRCKRWVVGPETRRHDKNNRLLSERERRQEEEEATRVTATTETRQRTPARKLSGCVCVCVVEALAHPRMMRSAPMNL